MSVPLNKPIARKPLCQLSEVFYVKQKTTACRLGAAESNRKAIIIWNMSWYIIPKRQGHTKNEYLNTSLYNWIVNHPQVLKSQIENIWLKVYIEGHSEKQMV